MDGCGDIQSAGWCLSLVIPAFNEDSAIHQAVSEADDVLAGLAADYEVLVVDDGSSDGTAAVVAEVSRSRPRVRLLRHAENQGYGAALRTGFEAARFDRIAFTDADCQFDLSDLASLVPLADAYPLVVGYRVKRQDSVRRRFLSWGYNLLARTLLGTRVRDCDCALKVFRREALADLLPESSGFFVNTEMLTRARQLRYRVTELGVRHRPRLRGASKVSFADIPRTLSHLLPFWWSRVLFAGSSDRAGIDDRSQQRGVALALPLLVLVALLLFFSRLRCPLLEPDEARYAEIPRQMLAEGRWMAPLLHGQPYYHKPPLLYWLVMVSYSLFGVHDWAARLVPCTAAFLVVLLTYAWGKRTMGARAGLAAALMLCLSARFVYLGRMLTMDSLLCLWVLAGLTAAHLAVRGPILGRKWWLLSAAACGLGLLTKGPVALALVLAPVAACQALDPRMARLRWRSWLGYLAVAGCVAAPWYLTVAASDPVFLRDFFWTHNVVRYFDPIDHAEPAWFYLPGLLLGMLPWTLLLLPLAQLMARRSAIMAMRRPAALGFFLLACLWCLVFYSAAGCKRPGYMLPAMPPLALALGCCLDGSLSREFLQRARAVMRRRAGRFAYRATLLVLTLGIAANLAAAFAGLQKPARAGATVAVAAVLLWCVYRYGRDRRALVTWGLCGVTTFLVMFAAIQQLLPAYDRRFSLRRQVIPHREIDPGVPVVCYPHRWDSVSFYLRRNDVRAYAPENLAALMADLQARPGTLLFVKSGAPLDGFLRGLPASLEFVPRGRPGSVVAGLVCQRSAAALALQACSTMPDSAR